MAFSRRLENYYARHINDEHLTANTAIKLKCIECSNYDWFEYTNCMSGGCPLWGYRLSRNLNVNQAKKLVP